MRHTSANRLGVIATGLALVAGAVVLVAPAAEAATYVVTTTADSGAGSLRQAIVDANNNLGADTINFALAGEAPHQIQPPAPIDAEPAYPVITDALTIDGTSQAGYGGVPVVQILEANGASPRSALRVQAADVTITGLSFIGFDTGVDINLGATGTVVSHSQFGMTPDGSGISGPSLEVGVLVQDGSGHVIRDNYISNVSRGVLLNGIGITGTTIRDNSIGISRDGTTGLPVDVGIEVLDSGFGNALDGNRIIGDVPDTFAGIKAGSPFGLTVTDNLIGVLTPGGGSFPGALYGMYFTEGGSFGSFTGNEIAGAQDDGIRLETESGVFQSTFFGNTIRQNVGDGIDANGTSLLRTLVYGNSIYENGGLGISIGVEGPNTPPDGGPTISDVVPGVDDTSVTVSYDGPPSAANEIVQVGFWTSSSCDPSGYGEGETPIGYEAGITLDGNGDFTDEVIVLGTTVSSGDILTAIVDGGDVDFTEFSSCFEVAAGGNNEPVALSTSATTSAGVPVDITLEGSDVDGDVLGFTVETSPTNGSVEIQDDLSCVSNDCTVTATYTPAEGFDGQDGFEFSVTDGDLTSASAQVDVTVEAAVNATPVAIGFEGPITTTLETPVDIPLFGTDADGDALTFLVDDPELGTIGSPGAVDCDDDTYGPDTCTQTWTYTPPIEYTGPDSFAFQVCDPSSDCDSVVVDVLVEGAEGGADLTMQSLTDAPDPVTSGGVVALSAQVKNSGPEAALNPVVAFADPDTGSLPAGMTFVGGMVSSSLGGSGSCAQISAGDPVTCTLGAGSIPPDSDVTWNVTVYLQTSDSTASSFDVRARASSDTFDPVEDNALVESTSVQPAGDDSTTEYVPPSNQTETVATSGTALVGGQPVPVARAGDTTAAALSVPPGGPGGVVTIDELACEPPFCAAGARTAVPTPTNPPLDNRVIQFVPPFAQYYDHRHPVRYTISYDATVVGSVRVKKVTALYTKDSEPGTLYRAARCPRTLTAATEFPCLQSAKILKGRNRLLKGDLVLVVLGTYNDPKIAGFR